MTTRSFSCLGILCGLVLSASFIAPADAMNINTSTVACQPIGAPSTDVRHVENGTYTEGVVTGPRVVTCAIPRSPLAFGGSSGVFYVTGDNRDGTATTSCTLISYDYTGAFLGSSAFATSAAHWVQQVSLPGAQLPFYAYTSVSCALPAGARADIESVVAVSGDAPAANINTNATECQARTWPQDDLQHSDQGIATSSTTTSDTWVSCAVPRSPLASGATTGSFWVDGNSFNGTWSVCGIAAYDYVGNFLGQIGFTQSGSQYDVLLTLPAAQLSYWAYTGMTCILPARGNAILRGVTSVQ